MLKDTAPQKIRDEYTRQSGLKYRGKRLFSDEYLIYSLSLRFNKSQKKIIEILELKTLLNN